MSKDNLAPLDGLRGIAIASVFLFHIATAGAFKNIPFLHDVFLSGWLGVDLFFAISGLLITRSAVGLKSRPNFFGVFYKNRARRILPAYLVSLAFLAIAFNLFYRDNPSIGLFNDRLPCLVFMCTNWETALTSTATPFGVNHFWSLAVEVQIYIFWPVVVYAFSKRLLLAFALGLALASFGYRLYVMLTTGNWIFTYFSTVTRLDSFALGAAAFLISGHDKSRQIAYGAMVFGAISAAITAFLNQGIPYNEEWSNVFGITSAAIFCSGLVLAVASGKCALLGSVLMNRYLVGLGLVSYSFYILHFPIMGSRWFNLADPTWKTFGLTNQQDVAMAFGLFVVSLSASVVMYKFVEKPFFRRGSVDYFVTAKVMP